MRNIFKRAKQANEEPVTEPSLIEKLPEMKELLLKTHAKVSRMQEEADALEGRHNDLSAKYDRHYHEVDMFLRNDAVEISRMRDKIRALELAVEQLQAKLGGK